MSILTLLSIKNTRLVGINEKYVNRHYYLTPQYRNQKTAWAWEFRKNLPPRWDRTKINSVIITVWTYKDLDSIIKCVLDAGNGVVWADDSQLTQLVVFKNPIKRSTKHTEAIEICADRVKEEKVLFKCGVCGDSLPDNVDTCPSCGTIFVSKESLGVPK